MYVGGSVGMHDRPQQSDALSQRAPGSVFQGRERAHCCNHPKALVLYTAELLRVVQWCAL
jgi:hypothetical protein